MGVHEAYHLSPANRALHWLCIPLELWAVVTLLAAAPLGPLHDAALVAVVVVAPIYLATEPLLGSLMVLFLASCRALGLRFLALAPSWAAATAALTFALAFAAQIRVGHGIFEGGRDDTKDNLAELGRTKNPIPILLVFYYHLVEIALAAGYRPALDRDIRAYRDAELATRGDPRS
jgi:uncharacterized membrane protein YGL010W